MDNDEEDRYYILIRNTVISVNDREYVYAHIDSRLYFGYKKELPFILEKISNKLLSNFARKFLPRHQRKIIPDLKNSVLKKLEETKRHLA